MYNRKIDSKLNDWYSSPNHKPLIVKGVRQCGKTSSVRHFAELKYEEVVYLDFREHPEYKRFFVPNLDVTQIIMRMSATPELQHHHFIPNKSCFIFDEIQDCPMARASLKYFYQLGMYKGAIYENVVADMLGKMERKLYYFHKDSGLELDFVIRYNGECVPVECKATTGRAKSLRTVLNNKDVYHVNHAIKLGDYSIGLDNKVLTLPMYMGFLIQQW